MPAPSDTYPGINDISDASLPEASCWQGRVIKYHSNYYYVKSLPSTGQSSSSDDPLLECFLKGNLKKAGVDVRVGDRVTLDSIDLTLKTGRVTGVLERQNQLERPKIANVDQVLVVAAKVEPTLSLRQLDRYLTLIHLADLKPVICITKSDLTVEDPLEQEIGTALSYYRDVLRYPVYQTSIHQSQTLSPLRDVLQHNISVLAGESGVGKSSLLNALVPGLSLRVGEVSEKIARGQHTTRHVELIVLSDSLLSPTLRNTCETVLSAPKPAQDTFVADTPGFSNLSFQEVTPEALESTFQDFALYRDQCAFRNCLHQEEEDCAIKLNLAHILASRYEHYLEMLKEVQEAEAQLQKTSQKDTGGIKELDRGKGKGKTQIIRLKEKNREAARRTQRQEIQELQAMELWDDE